MAYTIQALISDEATFEAVVLDIPSLRFVALPQAKVILPLTTEVSRQLGLRDLPLTDDGEPHLHLTTLKSLSGDLIVGSRYERRPGNFIDPLVIYRDAGIALPTSVDSALRKDEVRIPYSTTDGQVWPAGTRVVWPVACEPVK